jgi:hypothetical protein
MAHYAFLDENNIVVEVIVGRDEEEDRDWEKEYANVRGLKCKRTSYNTYNGVHVNGGIPFRKFYAGIGFVYIDELDIFLPPKPYASWIVDPILGYWTAPTPVPDEINLYDWDEQNLQWIQVQEDTQQNE